MADTTSPGPFSPIAGDDEHHDGVHPGQLVTAMAGVRVGDDLGDGAGMVMAGTTPKTTETNTSELSTSSRIGTPLGTHFGVGRESSGSGSELSASNSGEESHHSDGSRSRRPTLPRITTDIPPPQPHHHHHHHHHHGHHGQHHSSHHQSQSSHNHSQSIPPMPTLPPIPPEALEGAEATTGGPMTAIREGPPGVPEIAQRAVAARPIPGDANYLMSPTLTRILQAYEAEGKGNRELLHAILGAKRKEDERLIVLDTLRLEALRAENFRAEIWVQQQRQQQMQPFVAVPHPPGPTPPLTTAIPPSTRLPNSQHSSPPETARYRPLPVPPGTTSIPTTARPSGSRASGSQQGTKDSSPHSGSPLNPTRPKFKHSYSADQVRQQGNRSSSGTPRPQSPPTHRPNKSHEWQQRLDLPDVTFLPYTSRGPSYVAGLSGAVTCGTHFPSSMASYPFPPYYHPGAVFYPPVATRPSVSASGSEATISDADAPEHAGRGSKRKGRSTHMTPIGGTPTSSASPLSAKARGKQRVRNSKTPRTSESSDVTRVATSQNPPQSGSTSKLDHAEVMDALRSKIRRRAASQTLSPTAAQGMGPIPYAPSGTQSLRGSQSFSTAVDMMHSPSSSSRQLDKDDMMDTESIAGTRRPSPEPPSAHPERKIRPLPSHYLSSSPFSQTSRSPSSAEPRSPQSAYSGRPRSASSSSSSSSEDEDGEVPSASSYGPSTGSPPPSAIFSSTGEPSTGTPRSSIYSASSWSAHRRKRQSAASSVSGPFSSSRSSRHLSAASSTSGPFSAASSKRLSGASTSSGPWSMAAASRPRRQSAASNAGKRLSSASVSVSGSGSAVAGPSSLSKLLNAPQPGEPGYQRQPQLPQLPELRTRAPRFTVSTESRSMDVDIEEAGTGDENSEEAATTQGNNRPGRPALAGPRKDIPDILI